MSEPTNVHATGIVLDGAGIVLRGPSGAGKSLLALALLDEWELRDKPAFLVADDRLDLLPGPKGLSMRAPNAIAGLIELRGRGIVARPHKAEAPVHMVIDLVPAYERMLEEDALTTSLAGTQLPRCPVPQARLIGLPHQLLLVREALRAVPPRRHPRQKTT